MWLCLHCNFFLYIILSQLRSLCSRMIWITSERRLEFSYRRTSQSGLLWWCSIRHCVKRQTWTKEKTQQQWFDAINFRLVLYYLCTPVNYQVDEKIYPSTCSVVHIWQVVLFGRLTPDILRRVQQKFSSTGITPHEPPQPCTLHPQRTSLTVVLFGKITPEIWTRWPYDYNTNSPKVLTAFIVRCHEG